MRIVSWNVNGIRALLRKGGFGSIFETKPDIACLQEVKAEASQLPPEITNVPGYTAYFDHSKMKRGHSGVAVYARHAPDKVEYGVGETALDAEGRLIALHYPAYSVINIYFPNGGGGPERLAFKLRYYDAFLAYIESIRRSGRGVIFCGDINTAHEETDLARPKENEGRTGFLPEERAWIDEVVSKGYIDTFRTLHPHAEGAYTYWDMKTHARERNVGWRIDYFFVSPDLSGKVRRSDILADVYGSDHCPILLDIDPPTARRSS